MKGRRKVREGRGEIGGADEEGKGGREKGKREMSGRENRREG